MKLKLNYSNLKILKQNFPMLMGLLLLCLILILAVFFNLNQFYANGEKKKLLESEIEQYNNKKSLLDFKSQVIDKEFDLDLANLTLSQLIPSKEDYFSILAALENLSAKTNFIITSYNIIIDKSNQQRLAIEIEGQGDPTTFLEFLREYKFAGGRLITIDQINFSQQSFTGTKVNIYVYTGASDSTSLSGKSDKVNVELIKQIMEKVDIQLKSVTVGNEEYPTKSNPF